MAASHINNRALIEVESTAGSSSAKRAEGIPIETTSVYSIYPSKEKVNIFGRLTNATLGTLALHHIEMCSIFASSHLTVNESLFCTLEGKMQSECAFRKAQN